MGLRESLKDRVGAIARDLGYEIHRVRSAPPRATAVLPVPESVRGVHYACGRNIVPEWLNVDTAAPVGGVGAGLFFLAVDLAHGHPFADASFELGYAEDFLEHLSQAQSLVFLNEAYRTLRVGGTLRLSFPGLEGVLRKHYSGGSVAAVAEAQRDAYDKWGHVHFYARDELRLVAGHIGFQKVEFLSFQESRLPEFRRMDTRSGQSDLNTYAELTR